jgi:hypothetical protein
VEKGLRAKHAEAIRPVANLQEFFKDSVAVAMEKQGVAADDHTAYYVVNLLTLFARSEKLYERRPDGPGPQPLALLLAEAADAADPQTRNFVLQRVGDTSLFVAGFFQEGFARKLVDVDYYIDMGGAAYGWLSDNVRGTVRGRAFSAVFAELARKFRDFVDVLAEIRDSGRASDDFDILRLYDLWLKTGSMRAARLLRSQGIEPNATLDASTRH